MAAVVSEPQADPMKTPCSQSNASFTSGIVPGRRPPNKIAESGTPFGIFPVGINNRALRRGRGEARVRVRRLASGIRRPVLALPINRFRRRGHAHVLPPNVAVRCQRDVGENGVFGGGNHRVGIRFHRSARRDAEKAAFRIHREKPSILADANPGDVVAERRDFPARQRRLHHHQIGFAAGAGEGGGEVMFFALRRSEAEDEHVFRHPAFLFGDGGGDAEGETFFAEQRVAAITGAVRPDQRLVGEMNDVFVFRIRFARPGNIGLTRLERRPHGMQARDERAVRAELVEHGLAHARHDAHIDDHVRRVGDFNADFANGRIERAHGKRNDVHRPPLHAAVEQAEQFLLHLGGVGPIVRGAGFIPGLRADVSPVFDARHVAGMRAGEITTRAFFGVELDEGAALHHQVAERLVLRVRTVAPMDAFRLAKFGHLLDPGEQFLICRRCVVHCVRHIILC